MLHVQRSIPGVEMNLSLCHYVQTGFGAQHPFCIRGNDSFHGDKVAVAKSGQ